MNEIIEWKTQILEEHEALLSSSRSAVTHAIRIGELLITLKASSKHGEFLKACKPLPFSRSTAASYMKLAEWAKANVQRVGHLDLPLRRLVAVVAKAPTRKQHVETAVEQVPGLQENNKGPRLTSESGRHLSQEAEMLKHKIIAAYEYAESVDGETLERITRVGELLMDAYESLSPAEAEQLALELPFTKTTELLCIKTVELSEQDLRDEPSKGLGNFLASVSKRVVKAIVNNAELSWDDRFASFDFSPNPKASMECALDYVLHESLGLLKDVKFLVEPSNLPDHYWISSIGGPSDGTGASIWALDRPFPSAVVGMYLALYGCPFPSKVNWEARRARPVSKPSVVQHWEEQNPGKPFYANSWRWGVWAPSSHDDAES